MKATINGATYDSATATEIWEEGSVDLAPSHPNFWRTALYITADGLWFELESASDGEETIQPLIGDEVKDRLREYKMFVTMGWYFPDVDVEVEEYEAEIRAIQLDWLNASDAPIGFYPEDPR